MIQKATKSMLWLGAGVWLFFGIISVLQGRINIVILCYIAACVSCILAELLDHRDKEEQHEKNVDNFVEEAKTTETKGTVEWPKDEG